MAFLAIRRSSVARRARQCVLLLLGVCTAFLFASPDSAEAQQASEYEVKAAFLLNFTKFVEWKPDAFNDANSPLTICILGPDPFGPAINLIIENELVNSRRLAVRRIAEVPVGKTCQVLFISSKGRELRRILGQVSPGVLTVGNSDDFIESGGMIQFIVENRRVRFEIARSVAEKRGLQLSSQLLKVARLVR